MSVLPRRGGFDCTHNGLADGVGELPVGKLRTATRPLPRLTLVLPVARSAGRYSPSRRAASDAPHAVREFATGRFTKQELLNEMTRRGLKTRKGLPVSSQAFSTMLHNKLYVGIVDAPGYGVVGKRGDFDPLIPDDVFYRVQAILARRVHTTDSARS